MKRVWNSLPHTLLWCIWLAQNHKVFQDKGSSTQKICNKAKTLALETISINTTGKIKAANYSIEDPNLISYILENNPNAQEACRREAQNKPEVNTWKLRLKEEKFDNWIGNCNIFHLFFDEASKSNPSIAGAGGLISNANGDCILHYEWGLEKISNNRDEVLALLQGLIQLSKLGIKKVNVFGDSSVMIRLMVYQQSTPNTLLQQINRRNQILHQAMEDIHYYHILCNLNKRANERANRACERAIGILSCNSKESYQPLPWFSHIPLATSTTLLTELRWIMNHGPSVG